MMKLPQSVTGKIYVVMWNYDSSVMLCTSTMSSIDGYTLLGEHEITVDVPQEDPTLKIIAGLEAKAEDIQAEASAAVRQIMDQIKNLQCLEHMPGGDE